MGRLSLDTWLNSLGNLEVEWSSCRHPNWKHAASFLPSKGLWVTIRVTIRFLKIVFVILKYPSDYNSFKLHVFLFDFIFLSIKLISLFSLLQKMFSPNIPPSVPEGLYASVCLLSVGEWVERLEDILGRHLGWVSLCSLPDNLVDFGGWRGREGGDMHAKEEEGKSYKIYKDGFLLLIFLFSFSYFSGAKTPRCAMRNIEKEIIF